MNLNTAACVVCLVTASGMPEGAFPHCFSGPREYTSGWWSCPSGTIGFNGTFALRSRQVDWCECQSAPRPVFARKGNRCAAVSA